MFPRAISQETAVPRAKTKKTKKAKKNPTRGKGSAVAKKAPAKKSAAGPSESDTVVTVNRRSGRDRRKTPDRRKKSVPVAVERRKIERRAKVNRRRQIDPTTCERDYTPEEIEFMNALDDYKRSSGRMFPTCSEILEVIGKLGYEKRPAQPATPETAPEVQQPADGTIDSPGEPERAV
jgi:hypothetical protein